MKRLKRLVPTFACTLAVLIWTCAPVQAEFKGTLQRDQDWTLNVDNGATGGTTAVTVFYLGRSDESEFRTVLVGEGVSLAFSKPGRGVRRIIVEVNPPRGQLVPVELVQGQSYTWMSEGDSRVVFNVE